MLEELGISFSTALLVLIALYFVIKWAVKNGINESVLGSNIDDKNSYTDIQGYLDDIEKQSKEFKNIMKNK